MRKLLNTSSSMMLLWLSLILFSTDKLIAQEKPKKHLDHIHHYDDHVGPENPLDTETDLEHSFPEHGAIFGKPHIGPYFKWKEDLYKNYGLKLGFSYSTMFTGNPLSHNMSAEHTSTTAGVGIYAFEAQWSVFNKGKDWEGSITAVLDGRHQYGHISPAVTPIANGSLNGTDATFFHWDRPYFTTLYWEQKGKKDRFWFRVGNFSSLMVLDFFRFKDGRTSFSNQGFTNPVASLPIPAPSLAMAFNWKPIEGNSLYIAGSVQDNNLVAGEFDWGSVFRNGEVFTGLEIGKHWFRGEGDFDHAHLLVFHTDQVSTSPLPTSSGWGFKVHGTKQWGKLVSFANYTYNTAIGGTMGMATQADHAAAAGLVYLEPFNIKGEVGFGINYARMNPERVRQIRNPETDQEALISTIFPNVRDEGQWAAEVYWKMLVTPDLWITPGAQFIMNPTMNTNTDFIFAPTIKARYFF
ncbi:carbohydrate porin [Flammeovirga sp. SJP92]|uniref:carbohydrate porin n=1 Tax=Flammeovirga sp. SJP92 TaxID=1775430 RepID=UPI0007879F07|nr:carbohydrate porin [Flammeovirga sp. SJP92]KXX70485.1 hypothetical protein AVL50_08620 [Flammeovirga sp. SJP92]